MKINQEKKVKAKVKITTLEPLKENNNDIIINIEYELNNENENQKDIEIKKDENENKQKSKKFDIETYEPTNDNNNIDELFEKKERGNEPEDILDSDFRKPIIPKVNKEDINDDEIGPRDSKRKKQNNNNNNKNEKNKTKVPLNRGEIYNELHIKDSNDKINNYERNAITLGPYLNDIGNIKDEQKNAIKNKINNDLMNKGNNNNNKSEKRKLLRKLNFSVNFAPVADISTNESDYIYKRTLGENASLTSDYINAVVDDYVNDEFTCCLKHFPGYGNNRNTHDDVSHDYRTLDYLKTHDLIPFVNSISHSVPMIMVSHNIVHDIDDEYPSSISKKVHD